MVKYCCSSRARHRHRVVDRRAAAMVVLALTLTGAGAAVPVSDFAAAGLDGWDARVFDGETRYRIVDDDGHRVLEGRADASASGLFRELTVDLERTPRLAWRWWIDAPVSVPDERARSGDDFAARVYVVFDGGWAFWRTTTVVYVWADADAPKAPWRNPFTSQARMIAVRRGGGGHWHEEVRDVRADYRALFDRDPPPIVAVAVMADTDQSGTQARARWADLRFLPPEAHVPAPPAAVGALLSPSGDS